MYEWAELIKLWEHERLTMEQVIGQLLRYSQQSYNANADMQRALEKLTARITTLEAGQAQRTTS